MKKIIAALLVVLALGLVSCTAVDEYSAERSLAYGYIAQQASVAESKQPEVRSVIQDFQEIGYYYMELDLESMGLEPGAYYGIALAVGGAIEGIAKQPEAAIMFLVDMIEGCQRCIGYDQNWNYTSATATAIDSDVVESYAIPAKLRNAICRYMSSNYFLAECVDGTVRFYNSNLASGGNAVAAGQGTFIYCVKAN